MTHGIVTGIPPLGGPKGAFPAGALWLERSSERSGEGLGKKSEPEPPPRRASETLGS